MDGIVTRRELGNVLQGYTAELTPVIDSRFAFTVELMRHMFAEAGIMNTAEFSTAYQKLIDDFTEKFGPAEE